MTSNILPEYVAYHQALQDIIDNPPTLTASQLIEASDAINSLASAPESESQLLDEIAKMSGAALDIDQAFDKVKGLFVNVRNGMSRPDVKQDMAALENRWVGLQQNYVDLLWASRQVAAKAQAAADDFSREFVLFLGEDSVPMDEKKREIQNYIAVLDVDASSAQSMSQGFVDLQKNIQILVDDWKALVVKYDIESKSELVEKLQADLKQLSDTLLDLDLKIAQLTASLSISLGYNGAIDQYVIFLSFWIVLGVLIPSTSPLLQQIIDLYKARDERSDVASRYFAKYVELQVALVDLLLVQELQGTLEKSETDIITICNKISGFAQLWAMIRSDLQLISERLDYVIGTESEFLFKSRLKSCATLYALLGKALYKYQTTVTQNNLVFTSRGYSE